MIMSWTFGDVHVRYKYVLEIGIMVPGILGNPGCVVWAEIDPVALQDVLSKISAVTIR